MNAARKGFRIFAVGSMMVLALVLFMAGCSKSAGGGTSTNIKADVSLMDFFVQGEARGPAMADTLKAFKEKYPNINVTEDAMSGEQYEPKIKTLAASGELPDVFLMRGTWASNFSKSGSVNALDDILSADPTFRDGFVKAALSNCSYNGKVYSLPLTIDYNTLVFYNKTIFDKYNLTFPKTWDDLVNVIKVLQSKKVIPIALGDKDQWVVPASYNGLLINKFGGADYVDSLLNKDAKFSDQPYVDSLKFLVQLADMKAFNSDFISIDFFQEIALYGQGKAAMLVTGNFAAGTLLQSGTKAVLDATEVGLWPTMPNEKGNATTSGGAGWGVSINAKLKGAKRDAAINLMKAMSGNDWGKRLIEMAGMNPARTNVDYDQSKASVLFNKITAAVKGAIVTPVLDQVIAPAINDEVVKTTQAVLAKGMTAEEAGKDIQAAKDKVLSGK